MITIFASLIGFLGSLIPEMLKLFQDIKDKKHEVELYKLQIKAVREGHIDKLNEQEYNLTSSEIKELYKTYSTGINWVDAFNGTVRPVLAYAFFLSYCAFKAFQLHLAYINNNTSTLINIWNEEDQVIFASVISFYFGNRSMQKIRKRK